MNDTIDLRDEELLDIFDVARRLKLNDRTVRRMITRGEFVAPMWVGRSQRWRPSAVSAWIEQQSAAPPPQRERTTHQARPGRSK